MLGIRSITYNVGNGLGNTEDFELIYKCSLLWDEILQPHTQRINFAEQYHAFGLDKIKPALKMCNYSSIRWINIPFNPKEGNSNELFPFMYKLMEASGRVFVNIIGVEEGCLYKDVFKNYASLVHAIGGLDATGINNFRLGLSFNINYNCPFFPFTRACKDELSFSIALEMVEDINCALNLVKIRNLEQVRNEILSAVDLQIQSIYKTALRIEKQSNIKFAGFDFSLAPQISENGSIITILHNLGIYNFGQAGTMFATAFMTDILKELASKYPSVGFSGVMYSLLEDLELCSINNERGITVEQLISVSTMCGCGLDMVPINSDTTVEEITSLCLDIAGISCKYRKPLGVRLLSIPNTGRERQCYTAISDNADFIANTRVVPLNVNLLPRMENFDSFLRR